MRRPRGWTERGSNVKMWKLRPGQQFSNLSTHRGHLERFLGPWASVPRLQLALLAWRPHLENHNSKEFWDYFQSNGEPRNSHCVLDSTGLRFLQSRNDSDDYFPSLFRPLPAPNTVNWASGRGCPSSCPFRDTQAPLSPSRASIPASYNHFLVYHGSVLLEYSIGFLLL